MTPQRVEKKLKNKITKYQDLNKASKWAPDELTNGLKGKKETKGERKRRIKNLYKEKIGLITLRTQKYANRPFTYHVHYPQRIINFYKEMGLDIQVEDDNFKALLEVDDAAHPHEVRMGVRLKAP